MFFFKKSRSLSTEIIKKKLEDVIDVSNGRPLPSSGRLLDIRIKDARVQVLLDIAPHDIDTIGKSLTHACEQCLMPILGNYSLNVILTHEQVAASSPAPTRSPAKTVQWNTEPLPHVSRIIVVASGKGGVGKSTSTMLLAYSLAAQGLRVGVLDADIYGPSIPRMAGIGTKPDYAQQLLQPITAHAGVRFMSLGMMIEPAEAAVMRGPMLTKALQQMLRGTQWGSETEPLDILLIDTPPGTGDIPLSLAQMLPIAHNNGGAIIITTPQDIALEDVRRCVSMFEKLSVPRLGIIENMSYFVDPASGNINTIFGEGGGKKLSQEYNIPLLGKIPLQPEIRSALDQGIYQRNVLFDEIATMIMQS